MPVSLTSWHWLPLNDAKWKHYSTVTPDAAKMQYYPLHKEEVASSSLQTWIEPGDCARPAPASNLRVN